MRCYSLEYNLTLNTVFAYNNIFAIYCFITGEQLTPCQRIYQENWKNSAPGRYVPQCDKNGNFEPAQCHGPYCFCVDENGAEIRGTMVLHSLSMVSYDLKCKNIRGKEGFASTLYRKYHNRLLHLIFHLLSFLSWNNYYTCLVWPHKRHTRLNTITDILKVNAIHSFNTFNLPLPGKPLDGCQQKLRDYSLNPPKSGDYEPRCDRDGFVTVQCDRLANICWCVDRSGNERPGTRQKGHQISCPGEGNFALIYIIITIRRSFNLSVETSFAFERCFQKAFNSSGRYTHLSFSPWDIGYIPGLDIKSEQSLWGLFLDFRGFLHFFRFYSLIPNHKFLFLFPATYYCGVRNPQDVGYLYTFVSKCDSDQAFQKVQCDYRHGYCWCSDKLGYGMRWTATRGIPNCNNTCK